MRATFDVEKVLGLRRMNPEVPKSLSAPSRAGFSHGMKKSVGWRLPSSLIAKLTTASSRAGGGECPGTGVFDSSEA